MVPKTGKLGMHVIWRLVHVILCLARSGYAMVGTLDNLLLVVISSSESCNLSTCRLQRLYIDLASPHGRRPQSSALLDLLRSYKYGLCRSLAPFPIHQGHIARGRGSVAVQLPGRAKLQDEVRRVRKREERCPSNSMEVKRLKPSHTVNLALPMCT